MKQLERFIVNVSASGMSLAYLTPLLYTTEVHVYYRVIHYAPLREPKQVYEDRKKKKISPDLGDWAPQ